MENQIITLVLVLGTVIVLAIVVLRYVMPWLENIQENKHEYNMAVLEKGVGDSGLEKEVSEIAEEVVKEENKTNDGHVKTLSDSVSKIQEHILNNNTSVSFVISEFETILERLEKLEKTTDNLKAERNNSKPSNSNIFEEEF